VRVCPAHEHTEQKTAGQIEISHDVQVASMMAYFTVISGCNQESFFAQRRAITLARASGTLRLAIRLPLGPGARFKRKSVHGRRAGAKLFRISP